MEKYKGRTLEEIKKIKEERTGPPHKTAEEHAEIISKFHEAALRQIEEEGLNELIDNDNDKLKPDGTPLSEEELEYLTATSTPDDSDSLRFQRMDPSFPYRMMDSWADTERRLGRKLSIQELIEVRVAMNAAEFAIPFMRGPKPIEPKPVSEPESESSEQCDYPLGEAERVVDQFVPGASEAARNSPNKRRQSGSSKKS